MQYLIDTIKDLYPTAKFSLIDRQDGEGIVFLSWDDDVYAQPDMQEVLNHYPVVELRMAKEAKIKSLRDNTTNDILSIASESDQRNMLAIGLSLANRKASGMALSIAEEDQLLAISNLWVNQINPLREGFQAAKAKVMAAASLDELSLI